MSQVAAILLAAGQSKRMGAFKPLLPFGELTVIESCIEYLRQGGVETIVAVLGHRAAALQERLKGLSLDFAFNPDPNSEMGESIACGVSELPPDCEATFIAPTDYPAVPAAVVVTLIASWRKRQAKLLAPQFEGHSGHPVLVDLCFRDQLLNLNPQLGLRGLFDEQRSELVRVPVDSPFVARDIDTWEDYRDLYHAVFASEPPRAV
jgi:molybdenum cofactor cytidylyltransferase